MADYKFFAPGSATLNPAPAMQGASDAAAMTAAAGKALGEGLEGMVKEQAKAEAQRELEQLGKALAKPDSYHTEEFRPIEQAAAADVRAIYEANLAESGPIFAEEAGAEYIAKSRGIPITSARTLMKMALEPNPISYFKPEVRGRVSQALTKLSGSGAVDPQMISTMLGWQSAGKAIDKNAALAMAAERADALLGPKMQLSAIDEALLKSRLNKDEIVAQGEQSRKNISASGVVQLELQGGSQRFQAEQGRLDREIDQARLDLDRATKEEQAAAQAKLTALEERRTVIAEKAAHENKVQWEAEHAERKRQFDEELAVKKVETQKKLEADPKMQARAAAIDYIMSEPVRTAVTGNPDTEAWMGQGTPVVLDALMKKGVPLTKEQLDSVVLRLDEHGMPRVFLSSAPNADAAPISGMKTQTALEQVFIPPGKQVEIGDYIALSMLSGNGERLTNADFVKLRRELVLMGREDKIDYLGQLRKAAGAWAKAQGMTGPETRSVGEQLGPKGGRVQRAEDYFERVR